MLTALLAKIGLAPKTLPQATETLATAKTFAESVNALFTAAGLNLETLLAAGPDSLKAELAGRDNTAEVTRLTTENGTLTKDLTAAQLAEKDASARISGFLEALATVGFTADGKIDAKDFKSKFAAHVEKATTLKLATTGHPPKHVPANVEATVATTSDASLAADYEKLARGPEKQAFYAKHEQALWRHEKAKQNRAE